MIHLTTAPTAFEAKLVAARLGAAGVLWELRGNVDSVYPVGQVEVLVEGAEADFARELLHLDTNGHPTSPSSRSPIGADGSAESVALDVGWPDEPTVRSLRARHRSALVAVAIVVTLALYASSRFWVAL